MSGQDSRLLGRWGEALAAEYLRRHRCQVLASGWRCRQGEIDLIVSDGKYLAFVEVKLRKSDRYGRAGEFVNARKQMRLRTTAALFLAQNPTELQPRFDVIEIFAPQGMATAGPEVNWLKNAF